MKKNIATLNVILLFLFGCSTCPQQVKCVSNVATVKHPKHETSLVEKKPTNSKQDINLKPLIEFAKNFEPKSSIEDVDFPPELPEPPADVLNILENRKIDDSFKACVVLVILKVARYQLEHFHETHDIRGCDHPKDTFHNNPFWLAFAEIAQIDLDKIREEEFVSILIVESWVYIHQYFRRAPEINEEMTRLSKVQNDLKLENCKASCE